MTTTNMTETTKTVSANRSAGKVMIAHLQEVGRAKKKAGTATTAELAAVAGISIAQAYSRLYWLEVKEAKLESVGKGANRTWRLARKR